MNVLTPLMIQFQLVQAMLQSGWLRQGLKGRRRDTRLLRRATQGARKLETQLRGCHYRWWIQGQERLARQAPP